MKCTMILTGIVLVWESSNKKGENMKHFAIKDEVYEKVIFHLAQKDVKVSIGSWVEKACRDLIKQERFITLPYEEEEGA